jgi:hypothetical protein
MQYSPYYAKIIVNVRFLKHSGHKSESQLPVLTVQIESVAAMFKEICKQIQQQLILILTRHYIA